MLNFLITLGLAAIGLGFALWLLQMAVIFIAMICMWSAPFWQRFNTWRKKSFRDDPKYIAAKRLKED